MLSKLPIDKGKCSYMRVLELFHNKLLNRRLSIAINLLHDVSSLSGATQRCAVDVEVQRLSRFGSSLDIGHCCCLAGDDAHCFGTGRELERCPSIGAHHALDQVGSIRRIAIAVAGIKIGITATAFLRVSSAYISAHRDIIVGVNRSGLAIDLPGIGFGSTGGKGRFLKVDDTAVAGTNACSGNNSKRTYC